MNHEEHHHLPHSAALFPLRLSLRALRLGLRIGEQAVVAGLTVTGDLIVLALREAAASAAGTPPVTVHVRVARTRAREEGDETGSAAVTIVPEPPAPTEEGEPPGEEVEPGGAAAAEDASAPADEDGAAPAHATEDPTGPAHVTEDLRLVESFADPGAEDGAGASVHVDEPWPDYRGMTAGQVIERLADAGPEVLAAVELYEGTHRKRQTVLRAAQERLQDTAAGSGGGTTPGSQ